MLNRKLMIIHWTVGLIKRYCYIKMSYFPPYGQSKKQIEVESKLSNYATKSYLKNTTGVDTLRFAKKDDLANLEPEVDKLDIDKLAKLDANKLKPAPVDL